MHENLIMHGRSTIMFDNQRGIGACRKVGGRGRHQRPEGMYLKKNFLNRCSEMHSGAI